MKYLWNIFAYDSSLQKVILYSLRSSEEGLFTLKDYVFAEPDADNPEVKKYRNIPGIIKRTLELKDDSSNSLSVVQGLSATAYDTQVERQTQDGMQLMREARRVMLAVPVQKGTDVITAALSFAVAIDGTLSQIDTSPSSERLKSTTRDILLPRTRPAGEIKDSMYLKLTGKEQDLAAYYRLGTIVTGESKTVPDFSVHGRDALVYGEAYVSARTLNRATGDGLDAVKYSNDELFAVTQRATYEESFEFKVQGSVDINNADGNGNKIFAFSYWGRYSRNSEEKIAFPTHSYQPNDFELLSNGWYRASCQFTVPDGVSVIRTFEPTFRTSI